MPVKKAKKKRKVSSATLKALAAGRKKRLASLKTVKKTVKRKKPVKKSVTKKKVHVKRVSKLEPLHINISGEKTMKRRRRIKSATVAPKRRKRSVTRYSGIGNIGKKDFVKPLISGAVAVGGGIIGSILANKLPATVNPKIKAGAPVLLGLLLGMSKFARNNRHIASASEGMIIAGGLALARQFFPTAPLLAGENEVSLLDSAYMGRPTELGYEQTGTQPLENIAGDSDNFYYTAANI